MHDLKRSISAFRSSGKLKGILPVRVILLSSSACRTILVRSVGIVDSERRRREKKRRYAQQNSWRVWAPAGFYLINTEENHISFFGAFICSGESNSYAFSSTPLCAMRIVRYKLPSFKEFALPRVTYEYLELLFSCNFLAEVILFRENL